MTWPKVVGNLITKVGNLIPHRNTTGQTSTVNLCGAYYSRTDFRPDSTKPLDYSTGLPVAASTSGTVDARVTAFEDPGFTLDKVKTLISQLGEETKFPGPPAELNARASGQDPNFFKKVVVFARRKLGIGRLMTPEFEMEWARPDKPKNARDPAAASTYAKLTRFFHGAQDNKDIKARSEAFAQDRADEKKLGSETKVELRTAKDKQAVLENKKGQLEDVRKIIDSAIDQLSAGNERLTDDLDNIPLKYNAKKVSLNSAKAEVRKIDDERRKIEQQQNSLSVQININNDRCQALEQSLKEMDPDGEFKKLLDQGNKLQEELDRGTLELKEVKETLEKLEKGAAANSKQPVELEGLMNVARNLYPDCDIVVDSQSNSGVYVVDYQGESGSVCLDGKWVERKETELAALEQEINKNKNDIEQRQHLGFKLLPKWERTKKEVENLKALLKQLEHDQQPLPKKLNDINSRLKESKEALDKLATELEKTTLRLAEGQAKLDDFNKQRESLERIEKSLGQEYEKALSEVKRLEAEDKDRLGDNIDRMLETPPGFSAEQLKMMNQEGLLASDDLRGQLRVLAERLKSTSTSTDSQISCDQALELISRSLAKASEGNCSEAANALKNLMGRTFAQLVPRPGCNFNNDPDYTEDGNLETAETSEMQAAIILADLPGGVELLTRLVNPDPELLSERIKWIELRDAVVVYLRASEAIANTDIQLDEGHKTIVRLSLAQYAAKNIAREKVAFNDLSPEHKIAFNAVRNGFLDFMPGSEYDKASKALEKLGGEWVNKGMTGADKTSPLRPDQRSLAADLAADVQFPTADRQLILQLKAAVNALEEIVNDPNQSQRPGQDADQLLLAKSTLKYIKSRQDAGERLDKIVLGKFAWRAINLEVWREQNKASNNRPRLARLAHFARNNEWNLNSKPSNQPAHSIRPAHQLWGQRTEAITVLQALTDLKTYLLKPPTQQPTHSNQRAAPPDAGSVLLDPLPAALQALDEQGDDDNASSASSVASSLASVQDWVPSDGERNEVEATQPPPIADIVFIPDPSPPAATATPEPLPVATDDRIASLLSNSNGEPPRVVESAPNLNPNDSHRLPTRELVLDRALLKRKDPPVDEVQASGVNVSKENITELLESKLSRRDSEPDLEEFFDTYQWESELESESESVSSTFEAQPGGKGRESGGLSLDQGAIPELLTQPEINLYPAVHPGNIPAVMPDPERIVYQAGNNFRADRRRLDPPGKVFSSDPPGKVFSSDPPGKVFRSDSSGEEVLVDDSASAAPTHSASATPTQSASATPTQSASATPTQSASATPTQSASAAPTHIDVSIPDLKRDTTEPDDLSGVYSIDGQDDEKNSSDLFDDEDSQGSDASVTSHQNGLFLSQNSQDESDGLDDDITVEGDGNGNESTASLDGDQGSFNQAGMVSQAQPERSAQDSSSWSVLNQALRNAVQLKEDSLGFTSPAQIQSPASASGPASSTDPKSASNAEPLEAFVKSVIASPSTFPNFGFMTLSRGREWGFGLWGLFNLAKPVRYFLDGMLARPEFERSYGRRDQIRFGRDPWGLVLTTGRVNNQLWGLGMGVGSQKAGDSGFVTAGFGGSYLHTQEKTQLKDGVIVRMPNFDGVGHLDSQLSEDYASVLHTALSTKPKSPPDEQNGVPANFKGPLEALLEQHYSVSVATFDDSRSDTQTNSFGAGLFVGLGGILRVALGGFASAGVGANRSTVEVTRDLKANSGAQVLFIKSKSISYNTSIIASLFGGLGYTPPDSPRLGGVRGYPLTMSRSWNARLDAANIGSTLVRQPDGTIEGERSIEFTQFARFKEAMEPNREKWIEYGMNAKQWDKSVSPAMRRIITEEALEDFMKNAEASMAAKTVSFEVSMKVKPEVAAQLSANYVLEEMAIKENRRDDALALKKARDVILDDNSSYQPFFLKAIVRSSSTRSWGVHLGLFYLRNRVGAAARLFDFFPRPAVPTMYAPQAPLSNEEAVSVSHSQSAGV